MAKLNVCECGSTPKIIKLFSSKRYDCFVQCKCGKETKVYVSRQGAVNAWNNGKTYKYNYEESKK